ncbi:hypothetical protein [Streptomyces sp. NPDC127103]|uniref:hypothetical protein n=1 Tax=Streptomyces sp. NPDC127103 TaxID=3347139 RepID=UPI003660824E
MSEKHQSIESILGHPDDGKWHNVPAPEAEAVLDQVRAELDRIAALPTVTAMTSKANTFAVGARWAIRMIRENGLGEREEPAP